MSILQKHKVMDKSQTEVGQISNDLIEYIKSKFFSNFGKKLTTYRAE